jgi:hypothetical protein
LLLVMAGALNHIAVPRSELSTTVGSPVRSRPSRAAAIPPAKTRPDMPSPWPTMPGGHSVPVTPIVVAASEPRFHQVAPSYPPRCASGPSGPAPLPLA